MNKVTEVVIPNITNKKKPKKQKPEPVSSFDLKKGMWKTSTFFGFLNL